MDIRKIRKLIELVKNTDIDELAIEEGESSVHIKNRHSNDNKQLTAQTSNTSLHTTTTIEPQQELSASNTDQGEPINSPMVGTVYLAATPGDKPFVEVGQRIEVGQVLCLIEAMKTFNRIEAERSGVISARLIQNEEAVEYDQTLFVITDQ